MNHRFNPNVVPVVQPPAIVSQRVLLLTLCGIQFTHLLDFVVMMPLGPQLVASFGLSDAQFGTLVSAYTFAAAASGLACAAIADRFDRKQLLVAVYGLFSLSTLACALARSHGELLAARVAAGTFGGVLSAQIQTIVADLVPFERRGAAMGLVMSAFPLSSVLGLPLALALAAHWGWHAPFVTLAVVSGVLLVCAVFTVPPVSAHLHGGARPLILRAFVALLADPNYRRAFAFTAVLMLAGSTVQPFLTLYLRANVGLSAGQLPWVYFCGGTTMLVGTRVIGPMADRHGPAHIFRILSVLALLPLTALMLLPPVSLLTVLCVTTPFFLCMSGRMVPAMAVVQAVPDAASRGMFLSFNAAVQTVSMGLAAFLGGHLIGRDLQGHVLNYGAAGVLSALAACTGVWLVGGLRLQGAAQTPDRLAPRDQSLRR